MCHFKLSLLDVIITIVITITKSLQRIISIFRGARCPDCNCNSFLKLNLFYQAYSLYR